ncbi:MAG: hypothetical protein O7A03_04570 [Alphaproteobacteria bacterium]|nr:hypothetical protein [Alphaproteobacteria bacterium]
MAQTLAYRGPDAEGCWTDEAAGSALARRRLSIIDLSPTGVQPMVSGSGRWVIAYNGEVYNFGEIRDALIAEGRGLFRVTSDTEIVLEACEARGVAHRFRTDIALQRNTQAYLSASLFRSTHQGDR